VPKLPLTLVRDADGRPVAVRIRVPDLERLSGSGAVTRLRGAAAACRRRASEIATSLRPRVDVVRDADGRPEALRVRVPTVDVRAHAAAIAATAGSRAPAVPWRIRRAWYMARFWVMYAIPQIELRRDAAHQVTAIALRFGGRAVPAPDFAGGAAPAAETVVVVAEWINEPRRPGLFVTFAEAWQYRRFIGFLGARSFRKLYARTMLGWGWVLIKPLLPIVMNVLFFGALLGQSSGRIPYFLFLMVGNLSWDLFASAMAWSTRGLEMHSKVIGRVYVPRVILPIATMTPAVFNFLINLAATVLVVLYYWARYHTAFITMGVNTLWSVASIVMIAILVTGISMFTSVWGEGTRDARFAVGNVVPILFLLTPVLYPASEVPLKYQKWLMLNPMASFVEAFKYGFLPSDAPDPARFAVAAVFSVALLWFGLLYFVRHNEIQEAQVA
jgi:lipopolysaccharide transport system permease protein